MTKVAVICVLSLFALLIVLPITSSVNQAVGNPVLNNGTLRADGTPGPGLPPKKQLHSTSTSLVADGTPGPGLPPKKQLHSTSTSLVADGTPGPGLPPKKQRSTSVAVSVNV
jgi:hypothetical protein